MHPILGCIRGDTRHLDYRSCGVSLEGPPEGFRVEGLEVYELLSMSGPCIDPDQ